MNMCVLFADMKFYLIFVLILGVSLAQKSDSNAEDLWSWITGPDKQGQSSENKDQLLLKNAGTIDEVVDTILQSGRQGRNLHGFDQIYSDPNVKNAIETGNDTTARHYIKDRLCSLGLMQVILNSFGAASLFLVLKNNKILCFFLV